MGDCKSRLTINQGNHGVDQGGHIGPPLRELERTGTGGVDQEYKKTGIHIRRPQGDAEDKFEDLKFQISEGLDGFAAWGAGREVRRVPVTVTTKSCEGT